MILVFMALLATLSYRKKAGREGAFIECLLCAMDGAISFAYMI